jgi:hypothetical protein
MEVTVDMDSQQQQQQLIVNDGGSSSRDEWGYRSKRRITWILLVAIVSLFRVMCSSISDVDTGPTAYDRRVTHQEAVADSSSSSSAQQTTPDTSTTTLVSQNSKTKRLTYDAVVTSKLEKSKFDDVRQSNITVKWRRRAIKRAARKPTVDPREIVKKMPFENKRVAYVAFGSFQKGPDRFHTMIIDSLRTWLKGDVIFYVVNKNWETRFEEACLEPAIQKECKRIIPIFVDCPEGYYGASPCCKMDKGMTVMWENYSHYDWYSYQDDDMYIRTAYMDDFLSGLSPNEPMVLTCKSTRQLGNTWGHADKRANCSADIDFMYPWGQPAVYSRAGLERMSKAFQLGAIAKQCKSFDVTHDAGNPIVHWMVGLPEVRLPDIPPRSKQVRANEMGTHGVAKFGPNATEVHAQIGHVKHPPPPYEYKWHRPKGFLQTTIYKLHGNVSKWTAWHTMNISDCRGQSHLVEN